MAEMVLLMMVTLEVSTTASWEPAKAPADRKPTARMAERIMLRPKVFILGSIRGMH